MPTQQATASVLDTKLLLKTLIALKKGDFSVRLPNDWTGVAGKIADTLNEVIEINDKLTKEIERISRVVGKEGKITQHAALPVADGAWSNLIESFNTLIDDMARPTTEMARVIGAVANGDLSQTMALEVDGRPLKGEFLRSVKLVNGMVGQLGSFASEVTRVAREVGTEGKLGGEAKVKGVAGTWKDLTDSVNFMAGNLTAQVRNIAEVTTAVAKGDLSKKITVDVRGEILELKNTINTMVDQLNSFASEVTRVAREVGTEGKLGGQADVKGVAGVWKDLTDNVNFMAGNLTGQVRNIARVVTAVANGDLKRKLTIESKGEIAELANTINAMTDTLATFADQVTTVAREVGVEGKLGGQANVPGAYGTWRDLTDNVNQLAANLTTQVRAIAEVSTAVTQGDLTRSITVEAQGEVAALKDNINEMIRNLKDTTQKNTEQDWLKTNLARFTGMLQGQRDMTTVANMILSELAPLVDAEQGVFYVNQPTEENQPLMRLLGGYAYTHRKNLSNEFTPGEGLVGQCMLERKRILLTNVPKDYIHITSGLGEASPFNIIVLPVLFEEEVKAVIELASFNRFSEIHVTFLDQLTESIGIVLNTIEANTRTERLLIQSQSLAAELQSQQDELKKKNELLEQQAHTLRESEERLRTQQEELRQTNEELQEKATLLSQQKAEVEAKNREVEEARWAMEEKAEQLALTSKYKSEFLANMSHELRTPLNSMLILSRQLAENSESNLTPKQVQFAETINSSGADLLSLINDILDLTKIESGMMAIEIGEVQFAEVAEQLNRSFHQMAQDKELEFTVERAPNLPATITTDQKRLQQILKNLLSNAFKFTEKGKVSLQVKLAERRGSYLLESLNQAEMVVAFSVTDTGIGIPAEKQRIIFEAFQQADGTTSRKYGGTGLGLSISREIARRLGGEIRVTSAPGEGSTFTLYLPRVHRAPAPEMRDARTEARAARAGAGSPAGGAAFLFNTVEYSEISEVADDRNDLQPGDHTVLIVEDDALFAQILLDLAHEKGFKGVVAAQGDAALTLARKYKPDAITLDIKLPDRDGWTVLDRLKHDPRTSHIPVHVITADDREYQPRKLGALTHLRKPVTREQLIEAFDRITAFAQRQVRHLLVVEDDDAQRMSIVELIGDGDVQTTAVATGAEALAQLQSREFDCLVLDLRLPDMTGFELIEKIQKELGQTNLPIIVYTGKELTEKEETQLRLVTDAIVVKEANSPERLLAETSLFLHRVEANLPEPKRRMLEQLMRRDPALTGKKVLVVDDDVRNIFALTSALESYGMEVLRAENGREGMELLEQHPDIAVILLDVHMPIIDGLETAALIRGRERTRNIPLIFLTAYDSVGSPHISRGYSLGAVDYIIKPIDPEALKSKVAVFVELFRKTEQVKQQAELLREQNIELENANLQRLSKLIALGQQLAAERDPVRLLEKFCHAARDIIGARCATVGILEDDGETLRHFLASGVDQEAAIRDGLPQASHAFLREQFAERGPLCLSRLNGSVKSLRFLPGQPHIASFLGAPILQQGQVRGWLYLADKLNAEEFSEADERFAATLTQAVVFYENARLYAETERHALALEQEIAERKLIEKERTELLARERAARAEAEAANRLKDEFLATVSHELRAPLNAMLGWVHLVRTGKLDEGSVARALEIAERSARAQKKLIDDLLDVSRIITGKLRLDIRPIELAPVIESALESVRPAAEAKGVYLQTALDPLESALMGDANRLQQVVWNLVSNAIKFTPAGGGVAVRLKRHDEQVEIAVSDTGIGIAPEFLPYVFDRFRQADSSSTRKHGGLGLGLAIVRHLVELHGGTVMAESAGEGRGATFTIHLPLTAARAKSNEEELLFMAHQQSALPNSAPMLGGLRVLVVDDEVETRELLAMMLTRCEAAVQTAGSVAEAMAILSVWPPDILISDLSMPEKDGFSLIHQVRKQEGPQSKRIPAIALTAHAGAEDRIRALAAGFQMHLAKPMEPDELVVSIASLTGRLARARAVGDEE